MSSKKYFKSLDLLRIFACSAVLLYHLNILKGGYLAVCVFFVLSGYLSCVSSFRKEKFSIINYYENRLLKIYLPLIIIVFLSIFFVQILLDFKWLNLKPETTSVLFGYNNFWQLGANLDYFARHIDSPFMHLWYISILLQFELVFPFIYLILRKIGDKVNKKVVCALLVLISICMTGYFYLSTLYNGMINTYYDTFSRMFSLFFGITIGFIHYYYKPCVPSFLNKKVLSKIIFTIYLLMLIMLNIVVGDTSSYFGISMIFASLITCRLLTYGTLYSENQNSFISKIIKAFASISYEFYLIQYPVIFIFQYVNMDGYIKILLMIIIMLVFSMILHFSLNLNKKDDKLKKFRILLCIIIMCPTIYGIYKYIISEDHTVEMKNLENQLVQNQLMMQDKQEEYASRLKQEEEEWASILADLENGEKELQGLVINLPIVGVGDSVMLGAVTNLYSQFPNGYYDAKVSRTAWVLPDILLDLKSRNMLGNPIVLNLGANGDCPEYLKERILQICEDREIFWVNVTNDDEVHVNASLKIFAEKHPNVHVVDWNSISNGHSEYFYSDGIHLTGAGRVAYTQAIYDAIYNSYLEDLSKKKEIIMKEHEEILKSKISFVGNDLLLNAFESLQKKFTEANFMVEKQFTYNQILDLITETIENNLLNYKLVLAFDSSSGFSIAEYEQLISLCQNHEIYIVLMDKNVSAQLENIDAKNVNIIKFYEQIEQHHNYLMVDDIHLSVDGNEALIAYLEETIK